MTPAIGAPHTLVEIEGDMDLAAVYWDAGTSNERELPSGFFTANPFSVPHDASDGEHTVRLKRNGRWSDDSFTFTVTDPQFMPFPDPKITYIQTFGYDNFSQDSVSLALFVQGPNIDVGAKIKIDGVEKETYFWQALRNNMNGIDPRTYAYPIYHYAIIWCEVRAKIGEPFTVQVVNQGGGISNILRHTIPTRDKLDSDGDSLLDDWEINGYDADGDGVIDVNLPRMGATPYHFDLFVEVDWMEGRRPIYSVFRAIERVFENAPLMNIAYGPGIRLFLDRGQTSYVHLDGIPRQIPSEERNGGDDLPFSDYIRFGTGDSPDQEEGETTVNFFDLKADNFNTHRDSIFHYGIFAWDHGHSKGSSGKAEAWGDDLFLTRAGSGDYFNNENNVLGTFLHELGHNLGFNHGGAYNDRMNREPNYNSVMNYIYQFNGLDTDCDRTTNQYFSFSQGLHRDLNEAALIESNGVCGNVSVDWNEDGDIQTDPLSLSINGNDDIEVLTDYDDWGNILFNFQGLPNWDER